ncbi:hypothetical protein DFO73_10883 [Cytobacillus oceanisediminis]|uniref:Flagellar Assembly Protein A N-terminal region domain-containing protein n=1 Tax=Cytobacillus oceanisediminis TaxID=665099 RepID=A0A2V2ZSK7_9BACI|nr:FapA family protein [Cytobacillus oceanisediminis]PWW27344.1 hypothetical protein DFO73_10883 [Cytobacillus oceanisediminis]
MELQFQILFVRNRLSAMLQPLDCNEIKGTISSGIIKSLLNREKITFGINEEAIKKICQDPLSVQYPILIAEGVPAENGSDAYLLNEVRYEKKTKREKFNFRDVLHIPSVQKGQFLASIIPQTPGTPGKDIFGNSIPAKNGKPLRIKPGKNVILNGEGFYSLIDGQVSFTSNCISVNPVFEVKGDLNLKTGNIDFVGNVLIRGNVPAGYEIKAGGDIIVFGLVEGSILKADGNIIVSGGISGSHRGTVISGGNVQADYLNQAIIKAEQDIVIRKSVLHSRLHAGGAIRCSQAMVIGGELVSGTDIEIKESGNHLFTKTELHAGIDTALAEKEKALMNESLMLHNNHKKLESIEKKLLEMARLTGRLTEEQKSIILNQRTTKAHIQSELKKMTEKLEALEREKEEKMGASVIIHDNVFPNTALHFGKYSKVIHQRNRCVRFYFSKGEIRFDPLGKENSNLNKGSGWT